MFAFIVLTLNELSDLTLNLARQGLTFPVDSLELNVVLERPQDQHDCVVIYLKLVLQHENADKVSQL